MADSRLTVRTLGLAMVALVLACVHAARGDGRSGGVASFASGARSGSSSTSGSKSGSAVATQSSSGRGAGVVTFHGDPWNAGPDPRSSSGGLSLPSKARLAVKGRPRDRSAPHDPPVCVVRRPGESSPLTPPGPLMGPPAPEPADLVTVKATMPARNAFALSPNMASGMR